MGILVRQHGKNWIAKLTEEWVADRVVIAYLEDKNITFVEAVNGSVKVIKMNGSEFSTEDYPSFLKVLLELITFKGKYGRVKYKGEVLADA